MKSLITLASSSIAQPFYTEQVLKIIKKLKPGYIFMQAASGPRSGGNLMTQRRN